MLNIPSALEKLSPSVLFHSHTDIWIKRDDLIHFIISGNKARKLQVLLNHIQQNKPQAILSMGGNRSNFLHALAYIFYKHNIACHTFIRGHKPKIFGRTLQNLQDWGTHLSFIDKSRFIQLRDQPELGLQKAHDLGALWLSEGGSNIDALQGIMMAVKELDFAPDKIFVPVGTGCTALGLALGCLQRGWSTTVIGVVVLKGAASIKDAIIQFATEAGYTLPDNLLLEHRFYGKGFAKITTELARQQQIYETNLGIPLEPVYSVKMLNALQDYCQSKSSDEHIVIWHTGGLQGNTPINTSRPT